MRSAVLGAGLAVIVVVATLTFGASLHTLVSRPDLYGWNWNDELLSAGGDALGAIAPQQAATLLDPIANGPASTFRPSPSTARAFPPLPERPALRSVPPCCPGTASRRPTRSSSAPPPSAQLHKHVGDTVLVTGITTPTRLRIVGTATMPHRGDPPDSRPSRWGLEPALNQLIPASEKDPFGDPVARSERDLSCDSRKGPTPRRSYKKLQDIAAALAPAEGGDTAVVEPVQRPAEIVNYRTMGTTPALLAVAALPLAPFLPRPDPDRVGPAPSSRPWRSSNPLASPTRQRSCRRLAVLIAVGHRHRSSAYALGIVLGRSLWDSFAREIDVVPSPDGPRAWRLPFLAVGGLLLAICVGAVPGRIAARTPTASSLRTE